MRLTRAATILASIVLVLAAGCGDDDGSVDSSGDGGDDASEPATGTDGGAGDEASSLCNALDELSPTIDRLAGRGEDAGTTAADAREAIDQLEEDLADVQDEDQDLPEAVESALDAAAEGLEEALDDVADDEALEDASDAIATAREAIGTAWDELLEALGCTSGS
jgi:hypothetical protein